VGKTTEVKKTLKEINERIKKGKAVVLNAEEMTDLVKRSGKVQAAKEVDVVTTGTFSPMCSSGLLFNIGQKQPPTIKASKLWLNGVPCYGDIAAADCYIGATAVHDDDPLNKIHPGRFEYGGGHVIEDLVNGKSVHMRAESYVTDCYPRKELEKNITLSDLTFAQLFNPRNAYQNYNAAVNLTSRLIYTYMGPLKPGARNVNYATAGSLSPLFNDPFLRTIGLGTKIFLGGTIGWVLGAGTQHVVNPKRNERGIPLSPAGTLMVKGELKDMNSRYLRGVSMVGYGVTLNVGLGIPIPILDEEMAWFTGVSDADIEMPIKDYGHDYPNGSPKVLRHAPFSELKSGEVEVNGRQVSTVPMTSWSRSLEIADELKKWIEKGEFLLTEAQEDIPSS
jgi:uncharacterized protein (DUF39 family)